MIYKMATFKVKKDRVHEVLHAIETMEAGICSYEPDTLRYESFQNSADPRSFVHIMIFRNPDAEKKHMNSAHVKVFTAQLYPACEVEPEFSELVRVGDKPA